MNTKQVMLGCGIAALVALVVFSVTAYFGAGAFFRFGVGTDLSDHRDAIRQIDMDVEARTQLLGDLEDIRLSLDEQNNFGFFQWLEIDDSIQGIIADRRLDDDEYSVLQADIERMKRTQGLETAKEVERRNPNVGK